MTKMHIHTNRQPRPLLSFCELTLKEQSNFDYIEDPATDGMNRFVRYRGWVYDTQDMLSVRHEHLNTDSDFIHPLTEWDGYDSDTAFSGILLKYTDNYERVIMARYTC
jgi:hypothetical protein